MLAESRHYEEDIQISSHAVPDSFTGAAGAPVLFSILPASLYDHQNRNLGTPAKTAHYFVPSAPGETLLLQQCGAHGCH